MDNNNMDYSSLFLSQGNFMMDPNTILQQQPPPASLLTNELLITQLREIFPASIKSTGDEIKFLSRQNFKSHAAQAFQFIQFKLGNILSQYTEPTWTSGDDDESDDEKAQQRFRLYRLLNDTKSPNEETGKENVSWALVDDKLKKLPVPFRQKKKKKSFRKFQKKIITTTAAAAAAPENIITSTSTTTTTKEREDHADTRLGFRFANMFAVKRYFTFGERKTRPGEIHLIQTSDVPFLYNEVKPEYRHQFQNEWETRPDFRNGRFDPADQKYFKTFVLNPDQYYVIPENTIYVLLTVQKTLFSLDRYEDEAFRQKVKTDFKWKHIVFLSPNQQEQELKVMHVPTIPPPNVVPTIPHGGKYNNKRKRKSSEVPSLDNETDWVYNDELKPPKIFIDQNGFGGGGDIKFTPQYIYFEEPQQQQQQQDQLATIQNGPLEIFPPPSTTTTTTTTIFENVEMISSPSTIPVHENIEMISSPSAIPPVNQNDDEMIPNPPIPPVNHQDEEILIPTPSLWDEISFPTTATTQQDEELQKTEFDKMLNALENFYGNNQSVESVEPPPPVSDSTTTSSSAAAAAALDKLTCNDTPQQETLNELNKLLEEINEYSLDLLFD